MSGVQERTERFSGHESFVCRYGWLPKIYNAIGQDPLLLKDEAKSTHKLGIGRNMVKSLQFWAESTGVITNDGAGGHAQGPLGDLLFGEQGWDPHLEGLEGLWLIHWCLSTSAGIAAWNEVFGEGRLIRFDRQKLIVALAQRGAGLARPLAPSTLEQHVSIFVQSYYQSERGADDTSWCPLQDLGLIKASKVDDSRIIYDTEQIAPVGLTVRVFFLALVDFVLRRGNGSHTTDLSQVLKGPYSPGIVFRLDEYQLRQYLEVVPKAFALGNAFRFIDTADTQSIVLDPKSLGEQWLLSTQKEIENA
jgi:hypothetical protein